MLIRVISISSIAVFYHSDIIVIISFLILVGLIFTRTCPTNISNCSKSTMEILEKFAKYVQSYQQRHQNDVSQSLCFNKVADLSLQL